MKHFDAVAMNLLPGIKNDLLRYPDHMKDGKEWKTFIYNDESIPYLHFDTKSPKKLYLIHFHGANNSLEDSYLEYRCISNLFDIVIIAVEYPGFNKRDNKNPASVLNEYQKEVDYLLYDELQLDPKSIVIMGGCFGAFMCAHYLSKTNYQPSYCILNEPLISVRNFGSATFTPLINYLISEDLLSIKEYIPLINVPTLIIQGDSDTFNYYTELMKVMPLFKCQFKLNILPGSQHCYSLVNVMEIFFKERKKENKNEVCY